MSDAIRFLRDRIEKSLPLYQGDVDAALAQAIREDRAGRAVQDDGLPTRRVLIEVARRCTDTDLRDAARAVLHVDEWFGGAAPPLHDDPSGDESDER